MTISLKKKTDLLTIQTLKLLEQQKKQHLADSIFLDKNWKTFLRIIFLVFHDHGNPEFCILVRSKDILAVKFVPPCSLRLIFARQIHLLHPSVCKAALLASN